VSGSIQHSGRPSRSASRERLGVLAVAGGILSVVAVYVALNAANANRDTRDLLPFQTLARTLPEADRQTYRTIRQGLSAAEAERLRTSAWPEVTSLANQGIAPFAAAGASDYQWTRFQQGTIVDYFGQPRDPAAPAWLIEIQEPEPNLPPDPSPEDEEHHRLPDGSMLHLYVWMHRYGGQMPVGFIRQPQNAGWVQVFSTPPNPAFYNRR